MDYGTTAQTVALNYNATSANYTQGTNSIVFVVDNTGGTSGASTNNQTTESGLLVYDITDVVPEVSPWLPLAGALLTYGAWVLRHRRRSGLPSAAG